MSVEGTEILSLAREIIHAPNFIPAFGLVIMQWVLILFQDVMNYRW